MVMNFQVLSHAGLLVQSESSSIIFDPWLIGSCYWRSWWNMPAPGPELLENLRPDAIYLTHLHWDHFHGPSLKLFDPKTKIIVPKINHVRMVKDLNDLGFHNVEEISHGASIAVGKLWLHSYQFGPSNDSAAVVTDDKHVLYNLNDCKLFGLPLREITNKFGRPDFLLRSHSSATAIPYCIEGYERLPAPKSAEEYAREFLIVAKRLDAQFAIPFASNHCFVHTETMRYNKTAATPRVLLNVMHAEFPELANSIKVMPPGSVYEATDGFELKSFDYADVDGYVEVPNHGSFGVSQSF
jgi:UDP-MurNAc hydroxylase